MFIYHAIHNDVIPVQRSCCIGAEKNELAQQNWLIPNSTKNGRTRQRNLKIRQNVFLKCFKGECILGMSKIELPTLKCPHCGHEWIPRVANPRRCPRCSKRLEDVGAERRLEI